MPRSIFSDLSDMFLALKTDQLIIYKTRTVVLMLTIKCCD